MEDSGEGEESGVWNGDKRRRDVKKMERGNRRGDKGGNERAIECVEKLRKMKEKMRGEWKEIKKELCEAREEREKLKEQIKGIERRLDKLENRDKKGEMERRRK